MTTQQLKLEKVMSIEEIKTFLGKLKSDLKKVKNGGKRTFFLNSILHLDSAYENEIMHAKNFKAKYKQEKEDALKFLYDEEEQEAAGWNYNGGKKSVLAENLVKQQAWADKAYPKANFDLWETELDIENCIAILKSI